MREFTEPSLVEQKNCKTRAHQWYLNHRVHVDRLREEQKTAIAPCGIDIYRPELWKGIHWNWLLGLPLTSPSPSKFTRLWRWLFK